MYQCPTCKDGSDLVITANVRMHIMISPEGDVEESDYANGLEWDDTDEATCNLCDWKGTVKDIYHEEYETEKEAS